MLNLAVYVYAVLNLAVYVYVVPADCTTSTCPVHIDLSAGQIDVLVGRKNEHQIKNAPSAEVGVQGYLVHKKLPPPQGHHRALGIVLP